VEIDIPQEYPFKAPKVRLHFRTFFFFVRFLEHFFFFFFFFFFRIFALFAAIRVDVRAVQICDKGVSSQRQERRWHYLHRHFGRWLVAAAQTA
jgi:hypothetical protein